MACHQLTCPLLQGVQLKLLQIVGKMEQVANSFSKAMPLTSALLPPKRCLAPLESTFS